MFEPIHGSAFDITGKGIANPIATFWTGAMMLEHLGKRKRRRSLMKAIEAVTAKKVFTPDFGGTLITRDVTAAVARPCEPLTAASVLMLALTRFGFSHELACESGCLVRTRNPLLSDCGWARGGAARASACIGSRLRLSKCLSPRRRPIRARVRHWTSSMVSALPCFSRLARIWRGAHGSRAPRCPSFSLPPATLFAQALCKAWRDQAAT